MESEKHPFEIGESIAVHQGIARRYSATVIHWLKDHDRVIVKNNATGSINMLMDFQCNPIGTQQPRPHTHRPTGSEKGTR